MTNKKIALIGTRGSIKGCSFLSTEQLLNKVGQNTGNLLFQYATCNILNEDFIAVGDDIPWDAKLVKENCRIAVIPSANFIRENFDFSGFVAFLESLDMPLVFLGLGAQAADYNQTTFDFHDSILKLFELIKTRSPMVGVRGKFTQDLLKRFEITNTRITGCPTNFLNNDKFLLEKIEAKWTKPVYSFLATGDEPWPKNIQKMDAERKIVKWVADGPGIYIQQSVAPFIKYTRKSNLYQTEESPEHHEKSLQQSIAPDMNTEEFRKFIATRFRIYYSIDQWLEDSARFDFSTGLRLHGNMVAWQAGTPAVWVYHDSRTRELAETMALPHLSIEEFLSTNSIEELKSKSNFSFNTHKIRKQELQKNFNEIFELSKIKTCLL